MLTVLVIPPIVTETMAQPLKLVRVLNWKDVVEEFAGIVAEAGTTSPVFVDRRLTREPLGVGEVRLTVHVPELPGTSVTGEQINCESAEAAGESIIATETEVVPERARTLTVCTAVNCPAVTVKFAELPPPGTNKEDGTLRRFAALVERATSVPSLGADFERVTVQGVLVLGVRVVLPHRSEETGTGELVAAVIEKVRGLVEVPREAVMVAL
jgi:hypothetical protein